MHAILRAVFVSFAFLIFTSALSALAEEIEVTKDGAVRLTKENTWEKTGITVSPEALKFGDAWQEAYRNPGHLVPVKTRVLREATGPLEITVMTTVDEAVLYNENDKRILLMTDAGAKTETKFNPFLIFAGIAALAMSISNVLYARRQSGSDLVAFAFAAAAAFVVAFAFAAFAFVVAFAFAAFAFAFAAAAFAAAAVVVERGRKANTPYLIASSLFYGALVLSVILFYA